MEKKLKGKNIVLAVSGGIAAYKAVYLLRLFKKAGAEVQVIGTENSLNFIGKETWESLSGKMPLFSSWVTPDSSKITHIMLAQQVDALIVAPATANIIAKAANGIADDLVSTVLSAVSVPVFVAPSMNTQMFLNPATQRNIEFLKNERKFLFIEPAEGALACEDSGKGRMAEPETIFAFVSHFLSPKKKHQFSWLITGGASREYIDPIRFITNGSTGKTGLAIAEAAAMMGQKVEFIGGNVKKPENIFYDFKNSVSAAEMYDAVTKSVKDSDIFIMSAAVADYTPEKQPHKLKKKDGSFELQLNRTKDILFETAKMTKKECVRIGFAAETENLIENARKKLIKKELDMIVANLITSEFNPFGSATNRVFFVFHDSEIEISEKHKSELGVLIAEKGYELALKKRGINE